MNNKRLLPPAYLFISIIVMVLLDLLMPVIELISYPYNLIGGLFLIAGIILNLVADAAFKKHGTTVKPFEESTALIQNGAFSISRNPMYLGMVFILFGIAVFMGTLGPVIVVVVFAILMDQMFIKTEEKMLEKKFGAIWREYQKQARRWV